MNFSAVFHSSSHYKENPHEIQHCFSIKVDECRQILYEYVFGSIFCFCLLCAPPNNSISTGNSNNNKGIRLKLRISLKSLKNRRIIERKLNAVKTRRTSHRSRRFISFILNTILFHSAIKKWHRNETFVYINNIHVVIMKLLWFSCRCVCIFFSDAYDLFFLLLYLRSIQFCFYANLIIDNCGLLILLLLNLFIEKLIAQVKHHKDRIDSIDILLRIWCVCNMCEFHSRIYGKFSIYICYSAWAFAQFKMPHLEMFDASKG